MPTDYGYDMSCATDLTATLLDVSGDTLMAQVICRRLGTPNASLLSAPDETTCDLRQFLSTDQPLGKEKLSTIKSTATSALMADPRIFSVSIVFDNWEPEAGLLTLTVTGTGATGPFRLTLAITAVNIEVLQQ